jgi:DNA polymerase-3 subunit chi
MQLDFWQLSKDPVERVVALIAERSRASGEKLLVVDADATRRAAISLANGEAAEPHAERQPILLSADCGPANGARYAVFADGQWREGGEAFTRTFLLFDETSVEAARAVWKRFDGCEEGERSYFAQEDGKWVKKA